MATEFFSPPASAGGSGTVIPNNGTLSGEYDGSVLLLGDASMGADTIIRGDLFAEGNLFNPGGYNLTVGGDAILQGGFDFNTSPNTTPVGNIIVSGDFTVGELTEPVAGTADVLNQSQIATVSTTTAFIAQSAAAIKGMAAGSVLTWTTGGNTGDTVVVAGVTLNTHVALATPVTGMFATDQFTFGSKSGFSHENASPLSPQAGTTLTWTSGANDGTTSVVASTSGVGIILSAPTADFILPTDTFSYMVSVTAPQSKMQPSTGSDGVLAVQGNFTIPGLLGDALVAGVNGLSITVQGDFRAQTDQYEQLSTAFGGAGDGISPAGNGGTWSIQGDCRGVRIQLAGGLELSEATPAGSGGVLTILGKTIGCTLEVRGGDNSGTGNGGAGGQLNLSGGGSNNSVFDLTGGNSASADAGSSGVLSVLGGLDVGSVELMDGNGSNPATAVAGARIAGTCNIPIINTTDRADLTIAPQPDTTPNIPSPVLRGNRITGKTTLATSDLTDDTFPIPATYSSQFLIYDYINATWVAI